MGKKTHRPIGRPKNVKPTHLLQARIDEEVVRNFHKAISDVYPDRVIPKRKEILTDVLIDATKALIAIKEIRKTETHG